jgi:Flp pilus assembly protein TadG
MAVIFAIVLMTLMVGVGAAVDYSSIASKNNKYQNLADSAVLAAARSGETKKNKLRKVARDFVNVNNATGDVLTTKVILNKDGRLEVKIHGTYKPVIMGLVGKPVYNVEVVSEAPLASSEPVNIVLVLDTTFSMSGGGKMTSLKSSARSLVTTLEAFENDTLQMAVIPFSQHINIGLSRRNSVWLTNANDYTETFAEQCHTTRPVIDRENCRIEHYGPRPPTPPRPPGTCYNDGVAYSCGGSSGSPGRPGGSHEVCDNVYGEEEEVCYIPSTEHVWNGCVGSRDNPWNERAKYANHKIPALMDLPCGTEIQPLTNNLNVIKNTIASLNANGETYLPSGLLWGWRALAPSQPLKEARGKYKKNRRSVMILMTDGANTKSKDGDKHTANDKNAANELSKKMCRKIKAAKIEVYSIAFAFDDPEAKKILRRCATEKSMFFDARDSAELEAAFEDIGESLLKLRLTH